MLIREMSRDECLRMLAGPRLARLACAHENQPYVVPVYLAYHEVSGSLYGFTTHGQKVDWMRTNPLVCVEVDEVANFDHWLSVIVTGYYEELPESAENNEQSGRAPARKDSDLTLSADSLSGDSERERAWRLLSTHPMWQEPGCTAWRSRSAESGEAFQPIFYRINIDRISGHEATPGR